MLAYNFVIGVTGCTGPGGSGVPAGTADYLEAHTNSAITAVYACRRVCCQWQHVCCTGPGGGGIPAAATDYPEAQQGAAGTADGSPTPKKAPPPDERPWWQKNWIFLIPAGMLVWTHKQNIILHVSVQNLYSSETYLA